MRQRRLRSWGAQWIEWIRFQILVKSTPYCCSHLDWEGVSFGGGTVLEASYRARIRRTSFGGTMKGVLTLALFWIHFHELNALVSIDEQQKKTFCCKVALRMLCPRAWLVSVTSSIHAWAYRGVGVMLLRDGGRTQQASCAVWRVCSVYLEIGWVELGVLSAPTTLCLSNPQRLKIFALWNCIYLLRLSHFECN
jgi:hypothetical protein